MEVECKNGKDINESHEASNAEGHHIQDGAVAEGDNAALGYEDPLHDDIWAAPPCDDALPPAADTAEQHAGDEAFAEALMREEAETPCPTPSAKDARTTYMEEKDVVVAQAEHVDPVPSMAEASPGGLLSSVKKLQPRAPRTLCCRWLKSNTNRPVLEDECRVKQFAFTKTTTRFQLAALLHPELPDFCDRHESRRR
jgi:hypothetical protein